MFLEGEPKYDDIKLTRSKHDTVVATDLARLLLETKGDATAYISILMQHYKVANSKKVQKPEVKMDCQPLLPDDLLTANSTMMRVRIRLLPLRTR